MRFCVVRLLCSESHSGLENGITEIAAHGRLSAPQRIRVEVIYDFNDRLNIVKPATGYSVQQANAAG